MQMILLIGFGGFVGAISRFLLSTLVQKNAGVLFPIGTLSVNVLGGFLIGFLALYFEQQVSMQARAMVITGFLGALTTFSTFSYENVLLLEQGDYAKALLSIGLNVVLSLGATVCGMWVFKHFLLS